MNKIPEWVQRINEAPFRDGFTTTLIEMMMRSVSPHVYMSQLKDNLLKQIEKYRNLSKVKGCGELTPREKNYLKLLEELESEIRADS